MSKLTTLRDKDPKEVTRLLSVVSSHLLPNPGVDNVSHETGINPEYVKAVVDEIRRQLHIPEGDQSRETYSRIYAFLSEEISRATLTDVALNNVRTRLGNKGELHPSQYQVVFAEHFKNKDSILGTRKSYIADAVTSPDKQTHLTPKYIREELDPRVTISSKLVTTKRIDDRFILLVLSNRKGRVQVVGAAYRAYLSDINLGGVNAPVEVLESFVNTYGVTFRVENHVSKFMHNDIVGVSEPITQKSMIPVSLTERTYISPFIAGDYTSLHGSGDEIMTEIVLGFVVNLSKYVGTLRKHKVYLSPDEEEMFKGL